MQNHNDIKPMEIIPVKSDRIIWKDDNLADVLKASLPKLQEGDIVAITSKVVSLTEGRLVSMKDYSDKKELIKKEEEFYVVRGRHNCHITIKSNALLPTAGIDESNGQGNYILLPEKPFLSAQQIWETLKKEYNLSTLGIIITDSHTTPFRAGVSGFAISYWGFKGVKSCIGKMDLFDRPIKGTYVNVADNLASSAVLVMGESGERLPFTIIRNAPVRYVDRVQEDELLIPYDEDIYYPIFKKYLNDKSGGSK